MIPQESGWQQLEQEIKEWETLSLEIKEKREAFEKIIAKEVGKKKELQDKIFKTMDSLQRRVVEIDGITAQMKAGGEKRQGPTPTEKVTILMSKLNEATKKVVAAEFEAKTIMVPFAPHQSIKSVKGVVSEGIGSTFNKIVSIVKGWLAGIREMFNAADQLKQAVGVSQMAESKQAKIDRVVGLLEKVTGKKVTLQDK